jgi:hypothetical protein
MPGCSSFSLDKPNWRRRRNLSGLDRRLECGTSRSDSRVIGALVAERYAEQEC